MSRESSHVVLSLPPESQVGTSGRHRFPSPLIGVMNNLNIQPAIGRKRASSFKKPREKNLDDFFDEEMRPRTCSMPTRNTFRIPTLHRTHLGLNIEPDMGRYTVRSFKMNSKGVIVDRRDSMRSRSSNSVVSSESEFYPLSPSSRTSSSMSHESICGTVAHNGSCPSRVLVLGSPGVGKTALTQQFMTSEYLGGFDTSVDGEPERKVNVLLDGEETVLTFVIQRDDLEEPHGNVAAFLIIYACDDKASFDRAVDILYNVRRNQHRDEIIIFVCNKTDLVRSRCVSQEEAKAVAMTYDCKFVETSVVLNMNVDELLVGVVKQIRIRFGVNADKSKGCAATSKMLLNKIFKKDSLSKSCENLFR